jgi:magnesium chelatase family protein
MPGESKSSPREIQNYLGRISGPLLDRIDLHVEVPAVKFREISGDRTGETSAEIRERVVAARKRQHVRFKDKPKITWNARMRAFEIYTTHHSYRRHQKDKGILPSQAVSARNQDPW